jgi:mono/diheme cytochrome c family protein
VRLAAFVTILTLVGIVAADHYGNYAPIVAPVHVNVPYYSASYQPAETQAPPTNDQIGEILVRLKRMEDKLDEVLKIAREPEQGLPQGNPPGQPPSGPPRPGELLRSAAGKCASCHHADVFEKKGGGFQLFGEDGQFYTKLTARDQRKIVQMVEEGKMPPPETGKKLTEEEKKALAGSFRPAQTAPNGAEKGK